MKYQISSNDITGKSNHTYSSSKGKISLIYPCFFTRNTYEIYCLEGDLFEGTERYDTMKEAETAIMEYLEASVLDN